MRRCCCCEATERKIDIHQYVVYGINPVTNRKTKRTVNICTCCDAWGMASDEKLKEFVGLN